MNIAYFPNQIAQNAPPVLDAFLRGCWVLGHTTVENSMTADAAVIWSQVWAGKMRKNQQVWREYRNSGRDVFVLEVGSLHRGLTWKLGRNGIHSWQHFAVGEQSDHRAKSLRLELQPWTNTGNFVLICTQRADSEQWSGQPDLEQWITHTVKQIQARSMRPIVLRPHPRFRVAKTWSGVTTYQPQRVAQTYDSYDFEASLHGAHAVVNWNSGPGIQAVIQGVPVFTSPTSLVSPVGNCDLGNIENPLRPDRQQWLNRIAYTEWTASEIAQGWPLQHLLD